MNQQIDWPGIRAAAVAIGNVYEAARRAAIDLPADEVRRFVERVSRRSRREHWLAPVCPAPGLNKKPMSGLVRNGADCLATELADMERVTKRNLALATQNLSKQAINAPLEQAGHVHRAAQATAIVHGWGSDKGEDKIDVQVLSIGGVVNLSKEQQNGNSLATDRADAG
jgi:hypothetical protein